jgi:hypothetical protein
MPKKDYKERIKDGLRELRQSEENHGDRLFDQESNATEIGEIFQIASDTIAAFTRNHPTARLFEESNLNIFDPYDWGYLLSMFVDIHYVNKKQGRPKVQLAAFRKKLRRQVKEVAANKKRQLTDWGLARLFLKEFGSDYPSIKSVPGVVSLFHRHKIFAVDLIPTEQNRVGINGPISRPRAEPSASASHSSVGKRARSRNSAKAE